MIAISIFDRKTGSIEARMQIPSIEDAPLQCTPVQDWILGRHDPEGVFILNGRIEPRPMFSGFDHTRLEDLPAGSSVTVTNDVGDSLTITDLSDPLTLTDPGRYRFDVAPPFPFLTLTVEVDHA